MYDLRNLREMLCKELDEIADKREMSAGDLDAIQKQMQEEERGDGGKYVGYYSGAPAPVTAEPAIVGEYGDSEFLLAVAGKNPAKAWAVVDELMDTLSLVNRKVYDSVLRKIKSM